MENMNLSFQDSALLYTYVLYGRFVTTFTGYIYTRKGLFTLIVGYELCLLLTLLWLWNAEQQYKALFQCFHLCLSVILDIFSYTFPSVSCLTNWMQFYTFSVFGRSYMQVHFGKYVRETRWGEQEWTNQRRNQYWTHNKDKEYKTTTQTIKNTSDMEPPKTPGVNPGAFEW